MFWQLPGETLIFNLRNICSGNGLQLPGSSKKSELCQFRTKYCFRVKTMEVHMANSAS